MKALPSAEQLNLPLKVNTAWVHFWASIITDRWIDIIEPAGLSMLLVLKLRADWKTSKCSIGQEKLAQEANVSLRQVKKILPLMEKYGFIKIERKTQNSRAIYTVYDLLTPKDSEGEDLEPIAVRYAPNSLRSVKDSLDNWASTGNPKMLEQLGDKINFNFILQIDNSVKNEITNNGPMINNSGEINISIADLQKNEALKPILYHLLNGEQGNGGSK